MKADLLYNTAFDQELIQLRRQFHRYPEPAWLEYRTTVRIIEELEKLGFRLRWGRELHISELMMGLPTRETAESGMQRAIAETGREDLIREMEGGFTGVVGIIEGSLPGPTVAIRVDIDSNDLTESDDPAHRPVKEGFASVHPRAMHACAHDGHIAIGLGIARLLHHNRSLLRGKVLLLFQAAEEGGRGASSLVGAGLMQGVDYFYGGHIGINDAPVGTVSASTYGFLAGTKFDVHFEGKASHAGKAPEEGHNALAAASNAVLNLLAIPRTGKGVSRVNVGMMQGGSGRNVIPGHAVICAEARGGNQEVSDYMFESSMRVCRGAADMYRCGMTHTVTGRSECAECDMDFAEQVEMWVKELPGIDDVLLASDMGAGENITFLMNDVRRRGGKTTFLLLGAGIQVAHHSANFDFDERVIPLGARLFTHIAFRLEEVN